MTKASITLDVEPSIIENNVKIVKVILPHILITFEYGYIY